MKKRLLNFSFIVCFLFPLILCGQFTTAIQDGAIAPAEYGNHSMSNNAYTQGGTTYFLSWDEDSLYLATSGTTVEEPFIFHFDISPVFPINGGTDADGTLIGFDSYEHNVMHLPFRSDFMVFAKNNFNEFRLADGANNWMAPTVGDLNWASDGAGIFELSISWNTITGAGRPAQFNFFAYKAWGPTTIDNGVYDPIPNGNPGCTCNQNPSHLYATHYFNVLNTDNGTATPPFSLISMTYYQDNSTPGVGGYYLPAGNFYDITINDNSLDNLDNLPANHVYDNMGPANRLLMEGSIQISHDLYVGEGSALLPADNLGPDVLASLFFTGTGSIYNYGRIDANPEALAPFDWDRRRIDFHFQGTTTMEASPVFKDLYRLSNTTIYPGAFLLGPTSGVTLFEFQWGVLDNQGIIEFGDGSAGYADVGIRANWSQHNDYYFESSTASGVFGFHTLLIGFASSKLQPLFTGNPIPLQIRGNFENYDEFLGINGTGRIDVIFNGNKQQFLIGNTTETNGAVTSFHNIEIANDNGLSNNNDNSDVNFDSFGGGNIDYYVSGTLKLTSGDLITRDRVTSNVHNFIISPTGNTDFVGAKSNIGTAPSSFVDGPLGWQVNTDTPISLDFPIGKTENIAGSDMGDYRHVRYDIDLDAISFTTFIFETFTIDGSGLYGPPPAIPELITDISTIRYWHLDTLGGPVSMDAGTITLMYDADDWSDQVGDQSELRILQNDNIFTNWMNISDAPGGGTGGTASPSGTITSNDLPAYPVPMNGDFILADIGTTSFPIELTSFEVNPKGNMAQLLWETASEFNTDYFNIESQNQKGEWESIGRQNAVGYSTQATKYLFHTPLRTLDNGWAYFRLSCMDKSGDQSYQQIRAVHRDEMTEISNISYNPENQTIDIMFEGELPYSSLRIITLEGKELLNQSLESTHFQFPFPPVKGVYLIELGGTDQRAIHKVIIP